VADTPNIVQVILQGQDQLSGPTRTMQQTLEALRATLTQLAQGFQNLSLGQQVNLQSTSQLVQAAQQLAQGMQSQTAAYTQAAQASLAYKQQQDALRESLRQHREEQRAAADEARRAAQVWQQALGQGLAVAGGLGLTTSIQGAISGIKEFAVETGKAIVETGQKIQGLMLAFKGLGGSAQAGAADFAFVIRESQRLGLELTTSATTFRNFEAAAKGTALEGQQARDIFSAVAGAARVLGVQGGDLQRVFQAVDRMMQTNVINARELRLQLGTALPGSIEILARALGVTTQQLFEMTKQGTLLATEALPALARGLREELGGSVGEVGTLASTAFTRLTNELDLAKNRIAESGLLNTLRDLAEYGAKILEAGRKAGEQRQRDAGGTIPAIPTTITGLSPAIEARQKEIERLQQSLRPSAFMPDIPDIGTTPLTPADKEMVQKRIAALLEEQQKAVKALSGNLAAEGAGPGSVGATPLTAAEDRIRALLEEGQKRLKQIDIDSQLLPDLDVAQEKLKAWQETIKEIRAEFDKLPEAIRKAEVQNWKSGAEKWRGMIGPIAAQYSVDPALAEALIAQESGGDPTAVSKRGAKGLGQLMPGTAKQYGVLGQEFDPQANLSASIHYLADLLRQFGGDVSKALTAYNAGPGHGGIPLASGENATFAQDVLKRLPPGIGGLVLGAGVQQQALAGAVDANKPDQESLNRIRATGQAYLQGLDQEIRAQEQAVETLKRLQSGYTQTKEARDEDTAALLKAKFPGNEQIQQLAETVTNLAATREAYKLEAAALAERFTALKQQADAQREAEQAQADFNKKLNDTIKLLNTPKEQRTSERLRQQAPGGITTPEQEGQLQEVDTLEKAKAQEKQLEDLSHQLARNIDQTFQNLWENVFSGGVTDAKSFGVTVLQSLQRLFGGIASQFATMLLNSALGVEQAKASSGGGVAGAIAGAVVKLAATYFGSSYGASTTGLENSGLTTTTGQSNVPFAKGGIIQGGLMSLGQSGLRMRKTTGFGSMGALAPLMLAGGGVVRQPSFALIGEGKNHEAVVPLPDNRSIPVTFTGNQPRGDQPIIIHLAQDFRGTIDPRALKTQPHEIIQVIAKDITGDGVTRRVIVQHAK
jgi:tape measure domain-containing protein